MVEEGLGQTGAGHRVCAAAVRAAGETGGVEGGLEGVLAQALVDSALERDATNGSFVQPAGACALQ